MRIHRGALQSSLLLSFEYDCLLRIPCRQEALALFASSPISTAARTLQYKGSTVTATINPRSLAADLFPAGALVRRAVQTAVALSGPSSQLRRRQLRSTTHQSSPVQSSSIQAPTFPAESSVRHVAVCSPPPSPLLSTPQTPRRILPHSRLTHRWSGPGLAAALSCDPCRTTPLGSDHLVPRLECRQQDTREATPLDLR